MSDIRWVLTGGNPPLTDGPYEERSDLQDHAVEAWLATHVGKWLKRAPGKKQQQGFLKAVAAWEPEVAPLDDDALRQRFLQVGKCLQRQGLQSAAVGEAFAVVREASRRVLGKRHYDVQLLGGWIILRGMIAEMQTGEGKSLTATLPAAVAAAAGACAHVVTVNDYLAARDAEIMRPLYEFLGLTVGTVTEDMNPEQRRAVYACDVCYVSNKELVFDYLKDRLARRQADGRAHRLLRGLAGGAGTPLLLRGLHLAIVDEADSVLIDEARTPLIISRTDADAMGASMYGRAIEQASSLALGQHYRLTEDRQIELSDSGRQVLDHNNVDAPGLWSVGRWRDELVRQALVALHLFHRDQHYIVTEGKVQIVDESTGRVMADRTWERGLHQLVEAKEGCEISAGRETLAKMTYQRFFRRFVLLGGMTGTAQEVSAELWRVYELPVVTVPTHRRSRRQRLVDICVADPEIRWQAVAERAVAVAAQNRPVLIGTRSVAASEAVAAHLDALGVTHRVLNARQDKEEADIVAQAGQPGRITVATNMAGRGTDIGLGEGVDAAGGLHVILTEFHTSARIDRQLIGRCARQGDAGSAEALVSLDDELFVQYQPTLRRWCQRYLARTGKARVAHWLLHVLVRLAQFRAGRLEARVRKMTLKSDRRQNEYLAFAGKVE
jgi:preprotein translocase subunit SecA